MSTPNYSKKISELRIRVGNHVKLEDNNTGGNIGVISKITSVIPKINIKSVFFYTIPPFILTILFIIMKPGFVCEDHIDKDNVITKKIILTKCFTLGLISGVIVSIGLFAYFYKKS